METFARPAWLAADVETAKRLYVTLGLSATDTGRKIGKSKNAVIAKAHREGWAEDRPAEFREINSRFSRRRWRK